MFETFYTLLKDFLFADGFGSPWQEQVTTILSMFLLVCSVCWLFKKISNLFNI